MLVGTKVDKDNQREGPFFIIKIKINYKKIKSTY